MPGPGGGRHGSSRGSTRIQRPCGRPGRRLGRRPAIGGGARHRGEPLPAEEVRVKAGAPFVLVVTNRDPGPEEFESRELRIEKVIPSGKTVRLRMPALKAGTYPIVGEYHAKTAKGRIIAE